MRRCISHIFRVISHILPLSTTMQFSLQFRVFLWVFLEGTPGTPLGGYNTITPNGVPVMVGEVGLCSSSILHPLSSLLHSIIPPHATYTWPHRRILMPTTVQKNWWIFTKIRHQIVTRFDRFFYSYGVVPLPSVYNITRNGAPADRSL